MELLENENIICVSTSDWLMPFGSRQQTMSILARGNRVLYIESQLSALHLLKNPVRGVKRIKRWWKGLERKEESLYVYTPLPLFPFANYFIFINRLNQRILFHALRKVMKKLGFYTPIVWLYSVNSAALLTQLKGKLSVYYCIDDFSSEKNIEKRRSTVYSLEEYLLKKADIVFTCTKALFEDKRKIRPDIHFIRNGVNLEGYLDGVNIISHRPKDMDKIDSPRIGFIGTLDSRIDLGLLLFLASKKKDWQLVLIGDSLLSLKDTIALKLYTNIHRLGFKRQALLPGYLRMMDVCIIPYHTGGFHRYIFPMKTLEYLAAGKPVVSTYLPELEEFKEVIKLSTGRENFLANIEDFLYSDNDQASRRQEAVLNMSWENRVKDISGIISGYLKKKGSGLDK